MSNAQHTPGPWYIDGLTVHKNGSPIAEISATIGYAHADEANARLIAAAPDMKEAGKELVSALYALRVAYKSIQEHYGLKGDSLLIRDANAALKRWTDAVKPVGEE